MCHPAAASFTNLTPTRSLSFADWWKKAEKKLQKHLRKGFNSFCILGAWIIWKHRNACVFDGVAPNLQQAVQAFKDEASAWQFAGAKGLATLYSSWEWSRGRELGGFVGLVLPWSYP